MPVPLINYNELTKKYCMMFDIKQLTMELYCFMIQRWINRITLACSKASFT